MRILSIPTHENNEKQIDIWDVKKEVAAECDSLLDHLEDELGHIQISFKKRQQRTEQALQLIQSKQKECRISHAGLASRMDQIEDERDVLGILCW